MDKKLDKLAIGVSYQDKTNIRRWKSVKQDKRDRGNVWFIPYPTIQQRRSHPAVFPEKLPYQCIKLHGIKNDMVVYDPFMGIGSSIFFSAILIYPLSISVSRKSISKDKHANAVEPIPTNSYKWIINNHIIFYSM